MSRKLFLTALVVLNWCSGGRVGRSAFGFCGRHARLYTFEAKVDQPLEKGYLRMRGDRERNFSGCWKHRRQPVDAQPHGELRRVDASGPVL